MPQQKKIIPGFQTQTNESIDGLSLFLPEDQEWINLLKKGLRLFTMQFDRYDEAANKTRQGKIPWDWRFAYVMVETSALFYRIKLLDQLLQKGSINRPSSQFVTQEEEPEFDKDQFREAWYQVTCLLRINVFAKKDIYRPLKIGKAILRSLLEGEELSYLRGNEWERYIVDSDFF